MSWKELLANLQKEIQQHTLGTFQDGVGATAVVVTGCPTCRKKLQTINQFVRHLTDEVLPTVIADAQSKGQQRL
jgi:hypothetical protein